MQITVNNEPYTCADSCTLAQLLDELQIPNAGTAVACNDAVVRKALYPETLLAAGDRVEIIRAVAGG